MVKLIMIGTVLYIIFFGVCWLLGKFIEFYLGDIYRK